MNTEQINEGVIADVQIPAEEVVDTKELSLREQIEQAHTEAEERARDESGRFTKAEREAKQAQATEKQAGKQPEQAEVPPLEMPASLKREFGDKWKSLPRDVQEFWADREKTIHQGFTKMDDERSFAKNMREVITPYQAMIQAEGSDPITATKTLLNFAYTMRHGSQDQKLALFDSMCDLYNLNRQDIYNRWTGNAPRTDPQVSALQQELNALKGQITQEQQFRQQAEDGQVNATIDDFASQPGHEHFEAVRYEMGLLLKEGIANDMEDAYQRAIWANPSIRSTLTAEQTQADQTKRVAEAAAKVQQARKAGSSVVGAPGGNVQSPGKATGSIRDMLSSAFDEAMNS